MPKFKRERERVKNSFSEFSDNVNPAQGSHGARFKRKNFPILAVFFAAGLLIFVSTAFASSTSGTIDATNRYAWTENAGWLDFGGSYGSVSVTDSAISGYAYGENIGWVSLNCSNDTSCAAVDYKVANNGEGTLTGYAWGENAGWIKFNPDNGGVSIDSSGNFSGYAYGENIGWIVFNCSTTSSCATVDYKVSTDWRPRSARPACNNSSDDDGDGKTDYSADPGCSSADDTDETDPVGGNSAPGSVSVPTIPSREQIIYPDGRVVYLDEQPVAQPTKATEQIASVIESVSRAVEAILPDFLKSKPTVAPPSSPPPEKLVSETAPPVFGANWNLLPARSIGRFALAPLPDEILILAKKFPELGETFTKLGITRIGDLDKLQNAKFILSGISQSAGIKGAAGLSLSAMTAEERRAFPSEIVFAKAGDLIDYNIHIALTDDGNPEQRINSTAGKTLDLIVKVDKPAKNVKGYLTVKKLDRLLGRKNVPATSAMAAAVLSALGASQSAKENIIVEKKMVLAEFEYQDENNDGIYTAKIQAPLVHGEYEIISIIEYKDTAYGKKELRLTAVVDPEGYIYEKNGNKETRIPNAKVSLFWKNPKTGKFELWSAKQYQQVNPQKTDKSGTYSFLVPEGKYQLTVSAAGYYDSAGKEFEVNEGRGVHENISLRPKNWLRRLFNFLF